jgi:hypothetical protein
MSRAASSSGDNDSDSAEHAPANAKANTAANLIDQPQMHTNYH